MAEREAAATAAGEEDTAEEAWAADASDSDSASGGSASERDGENDSDIENMNPCPNTSPTASPARTWRGRFRVPAFQQAGTVERRRGHKRVRPYGVPSVSGEEARKRQLRGERFEREHRAHQERDEPEQPRHAWDRRRMGGTAGRVQRNDDAAYYQKRVAGGGTGGRSAGG